MKFDSLSGEILMAMLLGAATESGATEVGVTTSATVEEIHVYIRGPADAVQKMREVVGHKAAGKGPEGWKVFVWRLCGPRSGSPM